MKMYKATSLDDIAKQFRKKAESAKDSMNRCLDRGQRDMHSGKVMAFNEAADILENMELQLDTAKEIMENRKEVLKEL